MREDRTHLEIAVVGIGCRFPKADDAETFFGHLVEGRQLFSEVPRDRWDHRAFFSKSQRDTDKTWTPTGGFIDDVRSFAALHYGIPPRRLEVMDPQQRLLIETVREAIQDAGYEARGFDRARTGVFVGLSVNEYKNLNLARIGAMMLASGSFGPAAGSQALRDAILELTKNLAPTRAFSIAGNLTNMSAASVSQTFDFTGPSYTIDAACAAGATAIYDAVLHLRAGLVDVAMAGGAYVNLTPDNLVGFTRVGAISPSGVCRPFDARADGFVQGDGVAMLMLKRVGDALRDGDAIYGVLRGVGCNNDGRGEGPMTPRVEGQLDVLGKAYRDAAVSPATIAYFEAHGTGTRVGDPTEVEALGRLLTEAGVAQDDVRPLGSVKGNVGHTMSCAGVASLVKALKMVEHHVAPPLAGFETPHPELGFERWPVLPERAARPIDGIGGGPLRVGTSAFGFGGTNVHFVVEEAPPPMRRVGRRSALAARAIAEGRDPRPADAPHAVVVSAPSLALLRSYATTLCASLDRPELRDLTLGRLAYTLNATRTLERFRAVLTFASREELVTRLETLAALPSPSGAWPLRLGPDLVVHDRGEGAPPAPKVAFMFAGQGAQKTGLLEDWTRRFPRFADALRRLSLAGQEATGRPIVELLYPATRDAAAEAALTATSACQPAMAALGLAAAELLHTIGVEPTVSLGHSLGEFTALGAAAVIAPEDVVRLVARRGQAMEALALPDPGAMAAVNASADTVRAIVAPVPDVVVANTNQPRQVSISGTTPGVARAAELLRAAGLGVQPLTVSHAFHSPLLRGLDATLTPLVDALTLAPPRHVVASCIDAAPHDADPARTREILIRHATAPVEFVRALEQAKAAGATVFVQVGAGAMLASFARATLGAEITTLTLAPLEPDGGLELVRAAAQLLAMGVPVDYAALVDPDDRVVASLPFTPLEREPYWIVKDEPQLNATLTYPLPTPDEGFGVVDVEMKKHEATNPTPTPLTPAAAPVAPNALIALFEKQAELLRAHAEVIAAQNRLLLGGDAAALAALPTIAPQAFAAPTIAAAAPQAATIAAPAGIDAAAAPTIAPPAPVTITPGPWSTPPAQAAAQSAARAAAPMPRADAAAAPRAETTPAVEAKPSVDVDAVRERVLEVVSKVSAFPRAAVRGEQKLVDELGFDSLMVADLSRSIDQAFPALGGLPASVFSQKTTVEDLARHVTEALSAPKAERAAEPTSAEAPLTLYAPVERRLERRGELADVRGRRFVLVGAAARRVELDGLAGALDALGAVTTRVELVEEAIAPAASLEPGARQPWSLASLDALAHALEGVAPHGLVFVPTRGDGATGAALLAPTRTLHALARRARPALWAAVLDGSPAHAGVAGWLRALGRERSEAAVRAIVARGAVAPSAIVDELRAPDRDVDVILTPDARAIVTLEPTPAPAPRALDRSMVAVVSGGAGELGQKVAELLAGSRLRGLVLVGRRAADDAIRALVASLTARGTPTRYVAADLGAPAGLAAFGAEAKRVEAELGPVGLVVHAAGVIEDAALEKKALASVDRVLAAKVTGLEAMLDVFPGVKRVVTFSSWAARFGNAGQTDYAAANAIVDALAEARGVGALSIDWPPWSSSRMVRTIPATVQAMMRGAGVTFVGDDEGVALTKALLEGDAHGVRVVGRALPARVFARREAQAFSLARFPYLADHALKGDPVLPLAAAADLLADALAGATGADAVTIESLELVRGVSASKPGTLEARVDGRTGIDGTTDALLELWHDGALAYRAKGHVGPATPASVALRGAAITPALTLERFYGGVTFHGPRLRGIRAIDAVTQDGIRGEVVGAAAATALMPETTRGRFAIDPVLLDSAFQLAGFWAVSERRRAGYPIGFRRLVARRPTGGAALVATVALVEATDDRFVGDLSLATPSGEVVLTIEGLEGRFADSVSLDAPAAVSGANGSGANGSGAHASGAHASGAHASGAHASGAHASGTNGSGAHAAEAPTLDVPRETFDPAAFPEVEALDQRLQMAELIGLKNPYFTLHLGTARNRSNVNGVEMINFSSYNYLGFSGHPQVVGAAQRAIERYGTSVSASRVASGERPIHRELERAIADHIGVEDSIVLVSGHATNVTTIGTLVGADDIVVHDALAHESILSGIKQSHAARRPFAHQDLDALERTLRAVRGHYRRCLIAVEGIYSMDGDICDLPRLIELKKRYKALLMVDEAHSIGVLGHQGRGVAHHFADVNPNDVDVWMGTLSKSFSSCGGYIAGSKALVRLLKYSAGGFVYSAGITPPNAAAALESIALMRAQPEVVEKLRHNSRFFLDACRARGLDTGLAMGFAVIPVIVGNSLDALKLSAALAKQKINVNPIVYPAVEDDAARLRFFLSSTHTEDELTFTANTVADTLARIRRGEDEETTVAASP